MKERLNRSRVHRVFGGVAGGLAEFLGLDPIIIRILFIIITVINGFGLFLYIILWIVLPEGELSYSSTQSSTTADNGGETNENASTEKSSAEEPFDPVEFFNKKAERKSNRSRLVVGVILITVGFIFLAEKYFSYFNFIDFLPLLLVAVGILLIWNSSKK